MLGVLTVLVICMQVEGELYDEQAAKLVEEYVVAADFDNQPVAQLRNDSEEHHNKTEWIDKDDTIKEAVTVPKEDVKRNDNYQSPASKLSHLRYTNAYYQPIYSEIEQQDPHNAMVNSNQYADENLRYVGVIPAAAAPVAVPQRSLVAIGFMILMLLLSSVQRGITATMAMTEPPATQSTLLGGVGQLLLGRKRRSLNNLN